MQLSTSNHASSVFTLYIHWCMHSIVLETWLDLKRRHHHCLTVCNKLRVTLFYCPVFLLPSSNTAATTQFLSAEESEGVGVGHFPARGALLVELLSSKFPHQQKAYYISPQWHQMEPISLASTVSHYVEGSVSVGKSIANHNKVSLFIRTLKYSCNFIFVICSNPFQPLARCYMSNMISDSLPPFGWRASLFLLEKRKKWLDRNRPPKNGVIWRRVTERRTSTFTVTYLLTDPAQGKWRLCNRMCNLQ